jgi:hypothetical protein
MRRWDKEAKEAGKRKRYHYPKTKVDGDWRVCRILSRSKSGCGRVRSRRHASGQFRIDHYLSVGELPYAALRITDIKSRWELIGRFATLDEAKAAYKRHEPTNVELQFNSQGDPIVKSKRH